MTALMMQSIMIDAYHGNASGASSTENTPDRQPSPVNMSTTSSTTPSPEPVSDSQSSPRASFAQHPAIVWDKNSLCRSPPMTSLEVVAAAAAVVAACSPPATSIDSKSSVASSANSPPSSPSSSQPMKIVSSTTSVTPTAHTVVASSSDSTSISSACSETGDEMETIIDDDVVLDLSLPRKRAYSGYEHDDSGRVTASNSPISSSYTSSKHHAHQSHDRHHLSSEELEAMAKLRTNSFSSTSSTQSTSSLVASTATGVPTNGQGSSKPSYKKSLIKRYCKCSILTVGMCPAGLFRLVSFFLSVIVTRFPSDFSVSVSLVYKVVA